MEIKPQNRAGTVSFGRRKYIAHIGVNCGFMFSFERIDNCVLSLFVNASKLSRRLASSSTFEFMLMLLIHSADAFIQTDKLIILYYFRRKIRCRTIRVYSEL